MKYEWLCNSNSMSIKIDCFLAFCLQNNETYTADAEKETSMNHVRSMRFISIVI